MRRLRVSLLLLFLLALGPSPARAVTIGFECLTNNDAGDCAIGEAQFEVALTDQGGGTVRFRFKNLGPEASVLSEVYFDDGSLLALASVIDGPGVDFERDADPPDLPGGQNAVPPFMVTEGFLAQSVPSPSMNGAGPTEWVAIEFTLQGGKNFDDVVSDLANGALRIGLHVIAFDSGGSESFINVPEPGTGLLIGTSLIWGVARGRRSRSGREA